MRVIDILEAKQTIGNSKKRVELGKWWISRIDSFLNPNDPNRPYMLDPNASDPNYALTTDKIDANMHEKLKGIRNEIDLSIESNDGRLPIILDNFTKSFRTYVISMARANYSKAYAVDIFNHNAAVLYKLFDENNQEPVMLLDYKYPILKQRIPKRWLKIIHDYYIAGTSLVQQPSNEQTINQLVNLNDTFQSAAENAYDEDLKRLKRLRKNDNVTVIPAVRSVTNSKFDKILDRISDFIKLPNDSNEKLFKHFNYVRSEMTNSDYNWLLAFKQKNSDLQNTTEISTQIGNIYDWLSQRHHDLPKIDTPNASFAAKRQGKHVLDALGPLPPDYDKNNPMHYAWKRTIDNVEYGTNRKAIKTTYIELWDIVSAQQWKCYLTQEPLQSDANNQALISIDRIDSTLDYTTDNVRFCCSRVNTLKGNLFNNELVALCTKISTYNDVLKNTNITEEISKDIENFVYDGERIKKASLRSQLITLRSQIQRNFKDFKRYLFINEIHMINQYYTEINNEISNPTNMDNAKLILNNQKIRNLKNLYYRLKDRQEKNNDPEAYKINTILATDRNTYMSFDDIKTELIRIAKRRPDLKADSFNTLKAVWPYYRDIDLIGTPTISNPHSEKLHSILKTKYTRQRNTETDPKANWERYKPSVSVDDLIRIAEKQNNRCALSGIKFSQRPGSHMAAVSIDRIDSTTGGYSNANIQLVLTRVNIMKGDSSTSDFLKWCNLISTKANISVTKRDLIAALNHPNKNVTP